MPCRSAPRPVPEALAADSRMGALATGAPLRIGYFDASLCGNTGHQANACRHITRELRARGFSVDTYASIHVAMDLASELLAEPCFRLLPYQHSRMFSRIDFSIQAMSFGQDLRLAWSRGRYPFLYFNSVLAPQFASIGKWLATFRPGTAPLVAIEFGAPSGASSEGWFKQFAAQYRTASLCFQALDRDRILLFTFDSAASSEYSAVLDLPVAVLPPVHSARNSLRRRRKATDGRITLGFLGQQREEKGFNLLPEVIGALRQANCDARILVHDGDATERATTGKMREIAAIDPLVEFVHRPADPALWQELMDRTDLMVLPYEPNRYRASYSAVAVEAISAGVPMVVPGGTTMETLASEYQGEATSFSAWDSEAVSQAILRALTTFDKLSGLAYSGALDWARKNGAKPFVDRLMEFGAEPGMVLPLSTAPAAPVSAIDRTSLSLLLTARTWGQCIVHALLGTDRNAP